MRLSAFAGVVVAGLLCSTLAYQHLTSTAYYSNLVGTSDGHQRMTNQHAVVKTVGSVAAAPVPQLVVPDASPPPPPESVQATATAASTPDAPAVPEWMQPDHNYLAFNDHAKGALSRVAPKGTTLHFTFGSGVMMDFVKNCERSAAHAPATPCLLAP